MAIIQKDKRIIKIVSVEYALRAFTELKLNFDTENNNNKAVSGMAIKINNWIVNIANDTSQSITAQASINKAIMFSEHKIIQYNTLEDIFDKAKLLYDFFIK
nr:MAG: hypothetical protein B6I27_01660 [Erwiniaceae bacterium 4572_131]